ncbi:Fe-Mn family superoxide dismutase [Variovorax rhizosphaerae]|uniref:Fe-Mn family superoxide dismutase n=1 Tax=Variovorax rhizosphaerae TaxID=1836200 RepID=A0ABU8WXJ7_9BURK
MHFAPDVGSGWVVPGFNLHTRQLESWIAHHAHAHGPAPNAPVLVMYMYEHSYQMDCGDVEAKYIDVFLQKLALGTSGRALAAAGATTR